jgi:hypothetical protein
MCELRRASYSFGQSGEICTSSMRSPFSGVKQALFRHYYVSAINQKRAPDVYSLISRV